MSLCQIRGADPLLVCRMKSSTRRISARIQWDRVQWNLLFSELRLGDACPPKIGWQRALSTLRLRFETRAAYYLGDETLAMFFPLILA